MGRNPKGSEKIELVCLPLTFFQSAPFCVKCGIGRTGVLILVGTFAGSALLWWAFNLSTWVRVEVPGTAPVPFSASWPSAAVTSRAGFLHQDRVSSALEREGPTPIPSFPGIVGPSFHPMGARWGVRPLGGTPAQLESPFWDHHSGIAILDLFAAPSASHQLPLAPTLKSVPCLFSILGTQTQEGRGP